MTGVFSGAPIDLRDGYIHFSTGAQVRETARLYFAGEEDLLLVAVSGDALGEALKHLVREVRVAGDGIEGLRLYQARRPDIIITDIRMPRMDGMAMCEAIHAMGEGTPLILISAHDEKEYLKRALACKAAAFLEKPVDLGDIARIIGRIARELGQGKATKAHGATEPEREELDRALELLSPRAEPMHDPDVRAWSRSASKLNGDQVCHARGPNGDLFVLLADAIGHGLPAAITSMHLPALFTDLVARGYSLYTVLEHINRNLHTQHAHQFVFVAATGVRFDPRRNQLEVANCGMPDIHMMAEDGALLRRFPSINLPLGILPPDAFSGDSEQAPISVPAHLYLVSDGVTEARSADEREFGNTGLTQHLARPAQGRFEALVDGLERHVGAHAWNDDCTVVEICITPNRQAAPQSRPCPSCRNCLTHKMVF